MAPVRAALLLLALAGPGEAQDLLGFQTPSGNIHCLGITGEGASVDCEILQTSDPARPAPRPPGCDLDWGRRFAVAEAGPGMMLCAGDTVAHPGNLILPYGSSIAIGAVTCLSEERGLECRNPQGHGLFLSRAAQRVF